MKGNLSRRNFLFSLVSLIVGGAFYEGCEKRKEIEISCLEPRTHAQKTIKAFLETIIPGKENDPEGKPGAEEGCVINIFYDPYYSRWFSSPLELLAKDLDTFSKKVYGRKFIELTFDERTQLLIQRDDYLYYPAIALALIAFYSGWYDITGLKLIGFLPNAGQEDISYGMKFANEMTQNGNLP